MKIQIASDLHLDLLASRFSGYRVIEPTDADVLVIAGDIHRGTCAMSAFADWPVPVVYVHGNHEAYHEQYSDLVGKLRTASIGSKVHYLEGDEYIQDGVRFLGCCLWTDFMLYPDQLDTAKQEAEQCMLDYRRIATATGLLTADDTVQMHRASRAWLEEKLDEAFDGVTVVVTHHGPHRLSVHPRYAGSLVNAAFVSDLTPLMGKAALWIHGHVHDSFDYRVSGTRIVANPRGYALNRKLAEAPQQLQWENAAFDAGLIIEI